MGSVYDELLHLIRWKGEVLLWLTRTILYGQDLLPLKTTAYLQLLTIDSHELRLGPSGHVSIPSRYWLWNLLLLFHVLVYLLRYNLPLLLRLY